MIQVNAKEESEGTSAASHMKQSHQSVSIKHGAVLLA
jgi:hypothetical protein